MPQGPTRGAVEIDQLRWNARPAVAFGFRALVTVLPFLASWVAVRSVASHLLWPSGWIGFGIWIVQATVIATLVSMAVERASRRLLPLSMLFKMSLVFPDKAPSRFGIALRSGTARRRRDRIRTIRREGLGDDLAEAPARALELLTLLNMHDRRTRGHSERVRAYSVIIGEELGLSEEELDYLSWAALLHDVGKMDVPSDILNTPDKPSPVEWEILKSHPEAGQELLAPLTAWLGPWIGAATDHHERWDGSGYPRRLAGTNISLAGRIVAVADAYDVITSARSYKNPLSANAARRELVRSSGSQFDPAVVRAFLNVSLGHRVTAAPLAWLLELPVRTPLAATPMTPLVAGVVAFSTSFGAPLVEPTVLPFVDEMTAVNESALLDEPVAEDAWQQNSSTSSSTTATTPTTSPSTTVPGLPETTTTTVPVTTREAPTTTTEAPTTTTTAPTTTTTAPATTSTTSSSGWAVVDLASASSGDQIQIWVLDNDEPTTAIDYSTLRIVDLPANGSASVHTPPGNPSNIRIRYRSDTGFSGDDVFVYEICDVNDLCSQATVTVTVD